jgi:hypothetical protein
MTAVSLRDTVTCAVDWDSAHPSRDGRLRLACGGSPPVELWDDPEYLIERLCLHLPHALFRGQDLRYKSASALGESLFASDGDWMSCALENPKMVSGTQVISNVEVFTFPRLASAHALFGAWRAYADSLLHIQWWQEQNALVRAQTEEAARATGASFSIDWERAPGMIRGVARLVGTA